MFFCRSSVVVGNRTQCRVIILASESTGTHTIIYLRTASSLSLLVTLITVLRTEYAGPFLAGKGSHVQPQWCQFAVAGGRAQSPAMPPGQSESREAIQRNYVIGTEYSLVTLFSFDCSASWYGAARFNLLSCPSSEGLLGRIYLSTSTVQAPSGSYQFSEPTMPQFCIDYP